MSTIRTASLALAAVALFAAPGAVRAQDPPGQPPQRPAEAELVFDREVFQYPSFTRRNPFRPLLAADEGGPRYEQLSLIGVIYLDDPTMSVATLSTGGVSVADDGTTAPIEGAAFHLRVGERVGNVTIQAIYRDRVDVTVTEFDQQITRTMFFASRREGGTP